MAAKASLDLARLKAKSEVEQQRIGAVFSSDFFRQILPTMYDASIIDQPRFLALVTSRDPELMVTTRELLDLAVHWGVTPSPLAFWTRYRSRADLIKVLQRTKAGMEAAARLAESIPVEVGPGPMEPAGGPVTTLTRRGAHHHRRRSLITLGHLFPGHDTHGDLFCTRGSYAEGIVYMARRVCMDVESSVAVKAKLLRGSALAQAARQRARTDDSHQHDVDSDGDATPVADGDDERSYLAMLDDQLWKGARAPGWDADGSGYMQAWGAGTHGSREGHDDHASSRVVHDEERGITVDGGNAVPAAEEAAEVGHGVQATTMTHRQATSAASDGGEGGSLVHHAEEADGGGGASGDAHVHLDGVAGDTSPPAPPHTLVDGEPIAVGMVRDCDCETAVVRHDDAAFLAGACAVSACHGTTGAWPAASGSHAPSGGPSTSRRTSTSSVELYAGNVIDAPASEGVLPGNLSKLDLYFRPVMEDDRVVVALHGVNATCGTAMICRAATPGPMGGGGGGDAAVHGGSGAVTAMATAAPADAHSLLPRTQEAPSMPHASHARSEGDHGIHDEGGHHRVIMPSQAATREDGAIRLGGRAGKLAHALHSKLHNHLTTAGLHLITDTARAGAEAQVVAP